MSLWELLAGQLLAPLVSAERQGLELQRWTAPGHHSDMSFLSAGVLGTACCLQLSHPVWRALAMCGQGSLPQG